MNIGDKVICPGGYAGVITYSGSKVYVTFDSPELIPPWMEYNHCELINITESKLCECGGGKESYDHFKFCPAYKSGYDDFI